jgi:predicted nucleic acid-binding protein
MTTAELAEEAIQLGNRMQETVETLTKQRKEMAELCARFADVPAEPHEEEMKREAIKIYKDSIAIMDAALVILGVKP